MGFDTTRLSQKGEAALVALFFIISTVCMPFAACAQQAPGAPGATAPVQPASHHSTDWSSRTNTPHPVNLDLSSNNATVATHHTAPVTILEAGINKTITVGTLLTPSERIAVSQIVRTGQQMKYNMTPYQYRALLPCLRTRRLCCSQ